MNRLFGGLLALLFATLLVGTARAMFGGFGVAVYLPKAEDPSTKGAVLMVQPIGCHGPGASVSARAEGLVKGVRKSVALHLVPVEDGSGSGTGDTYMLRHEWPTEGAWVLVLTAKKESHADGKTQTLRANSLVETDGTGKVRVVDRPRGLNWDNAKVLPDGKTKLLPWSFRSEDKVVAMNLVWGDLKTAIDYKLTTALAHR